MKVAFLGTGVMGAPMARNLARAGLEVAAWNRTPAKAEALAGDGVAAHASAASAASAAEVLVTMLADGAAVEAAVGDAPADGAAGSALADGAAVEVAAGCALAALAPGAVWIQMSTVGAPAADRLGALAAEHGVAYVDAPVLGSRGPAENAELVVLASGPDDARSRCAPVLDALAQRTVWIGAAGAGSRLKIVVNAWLMSTTAALAETLALAEGLGVEAADFLDVTGDGDIGALYTRLNAPAMAAREFPRNFPLALAAKDAGLALEAAGEGAALLQVLAATHRQYERGVELGFGDDDWAAVIRAAVPPG